MRTIWLQLVLSLCCFTLNCQAEVYLSKDEALKLVFGPDCQSYEEPRLLSEQLIEELKDKALWGVETDTAHFFVCESPLHKKSYALIDSEVGKHLPITYIVGLNDSGQVTRVEVMIFREKIGWEAKERNFLAQFEGKGSNDQIQIGSSIRHVTGATLSSRAVAKGVRRAVYLWQHFYKQT